MDLRPLGRTGVKVSPLCLGAMMFGAWGNSDHDDSIRIIHRALDAGINFVDTADVYSRGESEEIVGKALKGRRDSAVLATKVHGVMGDDPNQSGNSRHWIMKECDASLRRLGTDWIDLYQIHRWDPETDHDETLGALTDLVQAGKVRYIGSSTYPPSQIVAAQWTAERRGRARFVTEQPPYSLLVRGVEAEVLPLCEANGMGVISWSPLAAGWLSGRWRKGRKPPTSARADLIPERYDLSRPENQRKLDAADALAQLADDAGMPLIHLAIAFVLNHPAVTVGEWCVPAAGCSVITAAEARNATNFVGIDGVDVSTQLRVAERSAELCEKRLGDDQLEVAGDPSGKKSGRGAARGEKRGDQDVWIENRSHSAAAATCGVLRVDRELDRLLFTQVVTSPKAAEQMLRHLSPSLAIAPFQNLSAGSELERPK